MKALPIIFAGITLAAAIFHVVSDPELKTKSLPTDRISYPEGKPKSVVVLISDEGGWSDREERASESLARQGAMVVGVDLPDYYAALQKRDDECLYLVSDIEDLSRQLHRSADVIDYHPPIVAGIGSGGTLALAIAAQTPDSTIAETLAVDPQTAIPLSTVLCTPADKTPASDGIVYGLSEGELPNPVKILFSPKADAAGRIHAENLKESHPAVQLTEASDTQETVLEEGISSIVAQLARSVSPLALPIVPIEVKPRHNMMAVIYSGDGGWRDIDQQLGAYMKEDGIPVVGVDALRYFWTEKTPEQTAADLTRIIETYKRRWKVDNVVLIGYSFGANILPATYRLLPDEDKQAVTLMSLLALSHHADFEIDVTGWLGFAGAGKYGDPVDDLQQVEPRKIQCIHGLKEPDSACPAVQEISGAQVLAREGGHHFDGDYRALNRLIVDRATAILATN
ncbi:virulence factor family protein [Rhizobium sp. XQZ8]|uniref:AcvB/VirJ family lysyl-phosphatidylglycerol hydrolase n=1 Tax=Rhizobium populisoli TaxID=2859785 RepID=UPI001CA56B15|nr:AcvB/VirJ family lysyl-phosphatidylglycerol hydrolase [Rhizobium populisoli]MBW6421073.1 virulence factor family protein [Rhizobium populisoli]